MVVAVTLVVVAALVGIWLARRAIALAARSLLAQRVDEGESLMTAADLERRMKTVQTLADRIATFVVGVVALLMILSEFDVDIGPAIAGLGVVGIAVGFGAQTLVRDWLAGIFIVLENQYSVGDVVSIAGVDGVVEGFSLRRTVLRNLDGTVHSVPNGQIVVASNMTRGFARVNVDFSVAYDTDIDRATEVIDR
jgi:small conductance mechanosensitive channel